MGQPHIIMGRKTYEGIGRRCCRLDIVSPPRQGLARRCRGGARAWSCDRTPAMVALLWRVDIRSSRRPYVQALPLADRLHVAMCGRVMAVRVRDRRVPGALFSCSRFLAGKGRHFGRRCRVRRCLVRALKDEGVAERWIRTVATHRVEKRSRILISTLGFRVSSAPEAQRKRRSCLGPRQSGGGGRGCAAIKTLGAGSRVRAAAGWPPDLNITRRRGPAARALPGWRWA